MDEPAAVRAGDPGKETPLMKQYYAIKRQHPDALLLFRVGDFYETFGEDAIRTAEALGIILTSRNNGGNNIELAGFPHHAMDMYLPKLVQAGYRVAICEQLEKPSKEKKIVDRGVTEMITPGIITSDALLQRGANNYLAAIYHGSSQQVGIAFLDLSTGEFVVSEGDAREVSNFFQSFDPAEVIFARGNRQRVESILGEAYYLFGLDDWVFSADYAQEKLLRHFQVATLKGFGIDDLPAAQVAAGAILHYLQSTKQEGLQHIRSLGRIHAGEYLWMDRFTIRNLELLQPLQETGRSLLAVLDRTVSPMGARLLRKWLALPLLDRTAIARRQDRIEHILAHPDLQQALQDALRQIGDLERLVSKVSLGRINPRELVQLRRSLHLLEPIRSELLSTDLPAWADMGHGLDLCTDLRERLDMALEEEAPTNLSKGHVIRKGFDETLDEYRDIIHNSKEILISLQQQEAARTGIQNLKIGYNNVFGYYLEVTNRYKDQGLIPDTWVRKQTLANCERYVTDELKKLEQKILTAEEQINSLEEDLFAGLVQAAQGYIAPIQADARLLAELDCLLSMATVAAANSYCRPEIDDSDLLDIRDGRHPVIERQLPPGEAYVPNDLLMNGEDRQIFIITGPNMSGKSALLRQTALIVIMAQAGSFVPASAARIGVIDKLFTRVGASDNISSGESTFMVEMNETASILNNLSPRSLILMDEIGRGTSTFDGISLAWSIAEYLHHHIPYRPKTLFATHYHELNELAGRYDRIHNYHVATQETGQKVIFLRKLTPGGSEHSFGIHVARMAGMPRSLLERATEILHELESKNISVEEGTADRQSIPMPPSSATTVQLSLFDSQDLALRRLRDELEALDIHHMTPVECMLALVRLQDKLRNEEKPAG